MHASPAAPVRGANREPGVAKVLAALPEAQRRSVDGQQPQPQQQLLGTGAGDRPAAQPLGNSRSGRSSPASGSHSSTGETTVARPGAWQDGERDLGARWRIRGHIVGILHRRKKNPTREWLLKLPDMARRLEQKLYHTASSKDAYLDLRTLQDRVRSIVLSLGKRKRTKPASKEQTLGFGAKPAWKPNDAMKGGHEQVLRWQDFFQDLDLRREMFCKILSVLHEQSTETAFEGDERLQWKAQRLEEQLYNLAPSKMAYNDERTLLGRIAHVMQEFGRELAGPVKDACAEGAVRPENAWPKMLPASFVATWHDPVRDLEDRQVVISLISNFLLRRRGGGASNSSEAARRLEEKLYRHARSRQDYLDRRRLESRLQRLACKVLEKNPRRIRARRREVPSMGAGPAEPAAAFLPPLASLMASWQDPQHGGEELLGLVAARPPSPLAFGMPSYTKAEGPPAGVWPNPASELH